MKRDPRHARFGAAYLAPKTSAQARRYARLEAQLDLMDALAASAKVTGAYLEAWALQVAKVLGTWTRAVSAALDTWARALPEAVATLEADVRAVQVWEAEGGR